MNEPIKIIYKVKNNNAKSQYYIYIYVGIVPENIMKILTKIQDISLEDTLNTITKTEVKDIEAFYGEKWYTFFFNKHHITMTMHNILTNKQTLGEMTKKYGEKWVKDNIETIRSIPQQSYSYGMLVKRNFVHHELRTKKSFEYIPTEQSDYLLTADAKKRLANTQRAIIPIGSPETKNMDDINDSSKDNIDVDDSQPTIVQEGGDDEEEVESDYDDIPDSPEEDIEQTEYEELEEIEQLYTDSENISKKEVEQTTTMIKKVMDDENILKKKESKMIKFDESKDTNIYKENLADVYKKNYVVEQFIFKDDAIKVIKNKICCSIKNNPKFGKKSYLIPSRQYMWGEYLFDNNYEKIMIGMKWTQKNELLRVDIEPNENIKVYEELRDTIRNLRNDLKRFNSKIRKDDEENNILFDYEGFFDNNELYLIDIYNELGKNYSPTPEALTNIMDTYIRIYFPKVPNNEIKNIIDYLNDIGSDERERTISVFELANTDLLLENEIVRLVEKVKFKSKYQHIMKENFVTQSMIHLLLRSADTENFKQIDLFKIFDDIIPSEKYPFVQYMAVDGNVTFKFNEAEIEKYSHDKNVFSMVTSWFQNVTYGISFKIRTDDMKSDNSRFMTVNLNNIGKIDYKIQWKEDDKSTIDDIAKTFEIIRDLIQLINETSIKKKFDVPKDNEFKTAFITTIQRFELDDDYTINHNDLSKFARYFYPYFALVIEPRKRVSKIHENELKSKFGTYLRYKRISKYENTAKIEQRIYYFIRNYEYTDQLIINEISKQFNLTLEKAEEHLKKTLQKYSHIKKARKDLKKFDISPKYKSPGIDIAIQGKTKDKYKIRVSGARDKQQLNRIITTLNVLIYLYMETYIAKKPEWQYLKDKLKRLNNIAERRHIVNDFVKYSEEKMNIKTMANADKRRIGYKPEKGQSHWTRVCQNSGTQQRRRPQQYVVDNIDEMLKLGYAFNKATGMYERKIVIKKNGKNVTQTTRAVKLNELDEAGNPIGNEIYYTCSPEQNGIHMYVGFLTRSKNPHGEYMPCCFKKDQYESSNAEKKNFFLRCIGKLGNTDSEQSHATFSDQLYILQDTNKIQPGRFGFLPKLLDFYMNNMLSLKKTIVQHYLISSPNGYFFKYGIEHGSNSYLSAIANALGTDVTHMLEVIINKLTNDKSNLIFTSLNNGDIRTHFEKRERYIEYLKNVSNIEYDNVTHVITLPTVITKNGLNVIIIARSHNPAQSSTDDSNLKDNCHIICQNVEELHNILDPTRETVLLYKEHDNYYPIFNVLKDTNENKTITITKTFAYMKEPNNIINHVKDFYFKNCLERTIKSIVKKENILTAKSLYSKLIEKNIQEYLPKSQYIDIRNKCRYIITNNNILIPVVPSGTVYNLMIITNLEKYYDTFENTLNGIQKLYDAFNGELPIQPVSVNCVGENSDSAPESTQPQQNVIVKALILQTNETIPVKEEKISVDKIKKHKLAIDTNPSFGHIDTVISTPEKYKVNDARIKNINYDKYFNESYELFRYVFSDYINKKEYVALKERIIKIIGSKNSFDEKVNRVKTILYRAIDHELLKVFTNLTKIIEDVGEDVGENDDVQSTITEETSQATEMSGGMKGGKIEKFVHIVDTIPDLNNYTLRNIRETCDKHEKDVCSKKPHCKWTHTGCMLSMTKKMAIIFVNKLSIEIVGSEMKSKEILQLDNYFVSDVVNKNYYTERKNQKVIKSTVENAKKTIEIFFGKENIDNIKKKRDDALVAEEHLSKEFPLKDFGTKYIQNIIPHNNSVLRAYANSFHWLENKYQDKFVRNIGYYSQKQTDIVVYLKSLIIDWALDKQNEELMEEMLELYSNKDTIYMYITKLAVDVAANTNGVIELLILNKIQKTPIVIYENDEIQTVFDGEIITKNTSKYLNSKLVINLQFVYNDNNLSTTHDERSIPDSIDVIYFK